MKRTVHEITDFATGDVVAYIPTHANGNLEHKDVECGVVSSRNDKFVFVKYFPALKRLGWRVARLSRQTRPTWFT